MHVYRPKGSKVWWIRWRDIDGSDRRWAGHADRRRSEMDGYNLEDLVTRKVTGTSLTPALLEWLARLPKHRRTALQKRGLLGEQALQTYGPVLEQLDDYKRYLEAGERTATHVTGTVNRITRLLEGIGAKHLGSVTAHAVHLWLKSRRDAGLSIATSNHYLTAIKGFCAWMVRHRRATNNPVAELDKLDDAIDRRHDRATLSEEELEKLLKTTRASERVRYGVTPEQRYWLYRVAVETGFRKGELRSLTVADFNLSTDGPTVTVRAAYSRKQRRTHTQPLARETAEGLREFLQPNPHKMSTKPPLGAQNPHNPNIPDRRPTDAAFRVPDNTAAMFRADLDAAGIPYVDAAGLHRDFHALRHTFITNAGYVVESFADLQALARHATPAMTARYAHPREDRMRAAVERLAKKEAGEP